MIVDNVVWEEEEEILNVVITDFNFRLEKFVFTGEIGTITDYRLLKSSTTLTCGLVEYTFFFIRTQFITKKINNSIDFLRHADETRFSNFLWDILQKLSQF